MVINVAFRNIYDNLIQSRECRSKGSKGSKVVGGDLKASILSTIRPNSIIRFNAGAAACQMLYRSHTPRSHATVD